MLTRRQRDEVCSTAALLLLLLQPLSRFPVAEDQESFPSWRCSGSKPIPQATHQSSHRLSILIYHLSY
jgi:hypothetical protein